MIWYTIAVLTLIASVWLLIACMVLRNKVSKLSESSATEEQETKLKAMQKKAKIYFSVGILCLILTEGFILLGNHII